MSLPFTSAKPPVYDPRDNHMPQRAEQYLDTLGNWQTYRSAATMSDVLKIVSQMTHSFLGVDLNRPSLTGVLGAILALHTLERLTAATVTFGLRLASPADGVLGWHYGIAVRASPFTPRTSRAMRWLLGSRHLNAAGWYFQEGGRTWHYQVLSLRVWGAERVLAHLRSISLPHRAHYFDRDIGWPATVEIATGRRAANLTLGHLGSINELEYAVGLLARAKLIAVAANWLLIDPDERAMSQQLRLNPSGGPTATNPLRSRVNVAAGATAGATPPAAAQLSFMQQAAPATNGNHRAAHYTSIDTLPPAGEWVKNRYYLNGRFYPLLVRNVVINPITRQRKADAFYYADGRWQPVASDDHRLAIAEDFDAGRMQPQTWPQAA
ncbi:MAG: hypothetical protein Kow0031_26560 [Anaerolineae bacterium]